MAGTNRLKLSALQNDFAYPMNSNAPNGRCLIHVKLTDFCVKTIENLMDSEKVREWFECSCLIPRTQ